MENNVLNLLTLGTPADAQASQSAYVASTAVIKDTQNGSATQLFANALAVAQLQLRTMGHGGVKNSEETLPDKLSAQTEFLKRVGTEIGEDIMAGIMPVALIPIHNAGWQESFAVAVVFDAALPSGGLTPATFDSEGFDSEGLDTEGLNTEGLNTEGLALPKISISDAAISGNEKNKLVGDVDGSSVNGLSASGLNVDELSINDLNSATNEAVSGFILSIDEDAFVESNENLPVTDITLHYPLAQDFLTQTVNLQAVTMQAVATENAMQNTIVQASLTPTLLVATSAATVITPPQRTITHPLIATSLSPSKPIMAGDAMLNDETLADEDRILTESDMERTFVAMNAMKDNGVANDKEKVTSASSALVIKDTNAPIFMPDALIQENFAALVDGKQNDNSNGSQRILPEGANARPHVHAAFADASLLKFSTEHRPLSQLNPTEQISIHIAQAKIGKMDKVTLNLHPVELGKIEIRMQIDSDNNTMVKVNAESRDTFDLLRSDRSNLERILQDAGLKMDSHNLEFGYRESGHDRESKNEQGFAGDSNGKDTQDEVSDREIMAAPLSSNHIALAITTGVNIRV